MFSRAPKPRVVQIIYLSTYFCIYICIYTRIDRERDMHKEFISSDHRIFGFEIFGIENTFSKINNDTHTCLSVYVCMSERCV